MKIINSSTDFPININIDSGETCYDVFIDGSFDSLIKIISQKNIINKKVCVITDSNLYNNCDCARQCINLLEKTNCLRLYTYVIKAGEESKNDDTVESAISFLLENSFNRDDLLIALGGGVITDITGFIAAIFKRGIDFFSIPTSLVSMTDSSVGGKNGINFLGFKNEIGTFKNPLFVYINTQFLLTLTDDLKAEGLVEITKSALVYDSVLFDYIYSNNNLALNSYDNNLFFLNLIYNSILIKSSICSDDPYDTGKRHLLNFGHTIGHAIEKLTDYKITHGQAVAIGILGAIRISINKGVLKDKNIENIVSNIFADNGLPVSITQVEKSCKLDSCMADLEENILYYISKDKKNTADGLKFVLLESVGRGIISNEVTEEDILGSF